MIELDAEILKEIKYLTTCDLTNYPFKRYLDFFYELDWVAFNYALLDKGDIIIRARENIELKSFNSVNELSYKPKELNKTYQRATIPNKTMFYGSMIPNKYTIKEYDNALLASVFEILRINDNNISNKLITKRVTIGVWEVQSLISLPMLMSPKDLEENKEFSNFREARTWLIWPDKKEERDMNIVTHFLQYHFTKFVDNDYEYVPSAAFTEYILSKGFEGIYYPGIRIEPKAFHVALTPESVDRKLKLHHIRETKVHIKNNIFLIEGLTLKSPNDNEFTLEDTAKHLLSIKEINKKLDSMINKK